MMRDVVRFYLLYIFLGTCAYVYNVLRETIALFFIFFLFSDIINFFYFFASTHPPSHIKDVIVQFFLSRLFSRLPVYIPVLPIHLIYIYPHSSSPPLLPILLTSSLLLPTPPRSTARFMGPSEEMGCGASSHLSKVTTTTTTPLSGDAEVPNTANMLCDGLPMLASSELDESCNMIFLMDELEHSDKGVEVHAPDALGNDASDGTPSDDRPMEILEADDQTEGAWTYDQSGVKHTQWKRVPSTLKKENRAYVKSESIRRPTMIMRAWTMNLISLSTTLLDCIDKNLGIDDNYISKEVRLKMKMKSNIANIVRCVESIIELGALVMGSDCKKIEDITNNMRLLEHVVKDYKKHHSNM